jgi:hypothetical protein
MRSNSQANACAVHNSTVKGGVGWHDGGLGAQTATALAGRLEIAKLRRKVT